ncbi:hypothetical protein GDO81_025035 [Engystomops pustulosus]|uniref:Uncharacterized protein n=1 Tax=Engystomops pustulosus TaxID=76066 RepID=A0AAV6YM10_ENGPU|nr:hypothetical protein GDO81_025035 [Engystomops pustulosus]
MKATNPRLHPSKYPANGCCRQRCNYCVSVVHDQVLFKHIVNEELTGEEKAEHEPMAGIQQRRPGWRTRREQALRGQRAEASTGREETAR